ncbi:hypothetical protein B0H11DRAFT_1912745 [Mycena galericulata]|nr:hypothetical protein B0H11DRAFT_1912745 [Mycena galericulata]
MGGKAWWRNCLVWTNSEGGDSERKKDGSPKCRRPDHPLGPVRDPQSDHSSRKALTHVSGRRPDDDLDVQRVRERISQSLGMFSRCGDTSGWRAMWQDKRTAHGRHRHVAI